VSSSASQAAGPSAATLERRLGPYDAAGIVVSNVLGGGIFYVPVIVAGLIGSASVMLGMWVCGGVLAFAGAMAYAELAALRPRAGGEYVYLRDAFGQGAAFLTGWTSFVAGFSGGIAAGALALADCLSRFLPIAGSHTPLLTIPIPFAPLVVSPQTIVALVVVFGASVIHLRDSGRVVHNLLAGATVAALAVFIGIGLSIGAGSAANFSSVHPIAVGANGWLLALVPIMYTYSGWNAATYVAEEIRDPGRNLPIALGIGTLAIVTVYFALNLLYSYAMPIGELAALDPGRLTDSVAERLFGFVAGDVLAAFTVVSIAASVSAMVLSGPRIYYAMARDGVFLTSAGRVHPRHRTPVLAIVAQGLWSGVLVLSGTLSGLVAYTGFAVVLFAGLAVLALFVLRRRERHIARPFHALGYPVAPAIFVAASAVLVVNEIWEHPATALAGLGVILAGWPLYWIYGRPRSAAIAAAAAAAATQTTTT
jgi:APA family basic amino acid/polyamine antiporter